MKFTQVLFKQHIGRQTRLFWYIQGKRTPFDINSEKSLQARGIEVIDPNEILQPKREKLDFKKFNFLKTQPTPEDENHPDWKENPCLVYGDNDLLVEGLPQAQLITKTVVFENVLPDSVEKVKKDVTKDLHEIAKRIIRSSVIFDAYQELLPKIKNPERPGFNYPRQIGITDVRKISNLSKKILQLCDCISGPQIADKRSILENALLTIPFEKEFDLFKFSLTMDIVLLSEQPLKPVGQNIKHEEMKLPSIYPLHHTAGIVKNQIYKFENQFPLISGYHKNNIHTIFVYYDSTKVKNLTELEVTETQVFGRALLKAFTAAASSARQRFGNDVKELPEPVTVQCIQSDGKGFYFSVYQLNTLNIDGDEGVKNYCWMLPKINLYETGGYVDGRPALEGYNTEVLERILAFYKNN